MMLITWMSKKWKKNQRRSWFIRILLCSLVYFNNNGLGPGGAYGLAEICYPGGFTNDSGCQFKTNGEGEPTCDYNGYNG